MNRLELRHALLELRLPRSVRAYRRRAAVLARQRDDGFSPLSTQRPDGLLRILRLARGRHEVVELGTATGWTAAALVLADSERRVTTFDPVVQTHRDAYLGLLASQDRARVTTHDLDGALGASLVDAVDLLFIDSSHDRAPTVAEFTAWRPRLAPDAIVVFDDYGHPDYPGVAEAVAELGLEGEIEGGHFVWRAPDAPTSGRV